MSEREARAARNEVTSREINEGIEEAHRISELSDYVRMVCECSQIGCTALIVITIAEYESVRSDARHFAVVVEHVDPEVEVIVRETERFVVVRKREGEPAQVAEQEDPRS